MFSLQIPAALEKEFAKRAAQKKCDTDIYIRQILEDYLEEDDDYTEACAVLERIDSGQEKLLSLEDVKKTVLNDVGH